MPSMKSPRRLQVYLFANASRILRVCLLAIILVSFASPSIDLKNVFGEGIRFLRTFCPQTQRLYLTGVLATVVFLVLILWRKGSAASIRYKNAYVARRPLMSIVGYVSWLLVVSSSLLFIKNSLGGLAFILFCFGLISVCSVNVYLSKDLSIEVQDSGAGTLWFSDDPIESATQDKLSRQPWVDRLYDEIVSMPFVDSFVFGLYGGYGDGKTVVIRLLTKKLAKNPEFLVVDFDPWNFKDETTILPAFYEELEKTLRNKFLLIGLRRAFSKYQEVLSPEISTFGLKFKLGLREESLEQIKQRIQHYITQTRKKLFIILDDIDRLQANEILFIFKLVRLNARFKNTIFLLSMDQTKVAELIRDKVSDPREFIEKIVQKPVPLPLIEQKDLERLLDTHLDKLCEELSITPQQKARFNEKAPYAYHAYIKNLFKNIRQVKTFLNSFRTRSE